MFKGGLSIFIPFKEEVQGANKQLKKERFKGIQRRSALEEVFMNSHH
jgi:hypothetical protein